MRNCSSGMMSKLFLKSWIGSTILLFFGLFNFITHKPTFYLSDYFIVTTRQQYTATSDAKQSPSSNETSGGDNLEWLNEKLETLAQLNKDLRAELDKTKRQNKTEQTQLSLRGNGGAPSPSQLQPSGTTSNYQNAQNVHKITTSPHSGRRFLAMVSSWTGSKQTRRNKFFRAWHNAWPELNIVTEYSFINHVDIRGYAILACNVIGMHRALEFAQANPAEQDFDYFIIFEDDAFPFENTTWPTGTSTGVGGNNNDLDQALDELEDNYGGALFLGSHTVVSKDRKRLILNDGQRNATIATLTHAYGAYGWIISRKYLPKMQQHLAHVLKYKKSSEGTSDDDVHFYLEQEKIGEYIATPLLVDHRSNGDSLTWGNGKKIRKWEGHRDWWNFQDWRHPYWDSENNRLQESFVQMQKQKQQQRY